MLIMAKLVVCLLAAKKGEMTVLEVSNTRFPLVTIGIGKAGKC